MKDNIYGNIPCFLGAENLVQKGVYDTDVIFYGAPFEGESTWGDYTGVELGPKQIRSSSARYSGYLPELDHVEVTQVIFHLWHMIMNSPIKISRIFLPNYGKLVNF